MVKQPVNQRSMHPLVRARPRILVPLNLFMLMGIGYDLTLGWNPRYSFLGIPVSVTGPLLAAILFLLAGVTVTLVVRDLCYVTIDDGSLNVLLPFALDRWLSGYRFPVAPETKLRLVAEPVADTDRVRFSVTENGRTRRSFVLPRSWLDTGTKDRIHASTHGVLWPD